MGLQYNDYDMKVLKNVKSIDYYINKYPELDYMTIARYVTDYNNAVAGIDAKKVEIDALEGTIEMAELLLKEGELSQLELEEKEVSLAKAQYELEQYYVSMNMAYHNLITLCEK